jgi:hypothetical protein
MSTALKSLAWLALIMLVFTLGGVRWGTVKKNVLNFRDRHTHLYDNGGDWG